MPFFAEISRSTLAEQLIKLQGTVISILTGNTSISALVHPNHDLLSDTSIAVRLRSMSALAEQYQRMSQAAPILPPPAPRPRKDCDGTLSYRSDGKWGFQDVIKWQCSRCDWVIRHCRNDTVLFKKHISCTKNYLEYFHAKGESGRFRCALCDDERLGSPEMREHLKDAHGFNCEEAWKNEDGCEYHLVAAYIRAEKTRKMMT